MTGLSPEVVAARLRKGAALFRFLAAHHAREAMEGRHPDDGVLAVPREDTFSAVAARRLKVFRALDRRRQVLARAGALATASRSPSAPNKHGQ